MREKFMHTKTSTQLDEVKFYVLFCSQILNFLGWANAVSDFRATTKRH